MFLLYHAYVYLEFLILACTIYILAPCRFIVFDFDNHEKGAEVTDFANTDNEWHKEVDALRKMCVPIFYIRAFH